MSYRSDGTFPPYSKIDVAEDIWPDNYWDSSRYCSGCGKHWPIIGLFSECPSDGKATQIVTTPPDMRWPEAVKALLAYRFEKWYDEYNQNTDDDNLAWADVTTDGQFDADKAQAEIEALIDDIEGSPIRKSA